MELTPEQIERIQPELPSPARVYDYLLGGAHNFPSDQAAAQQMLAWLPNLPELAHANRRFLKRAVIYLLEQGIDQFIDIGAGIPTQGNVHEIVREQNAAARVVYVDNDPIAVMHSSFIIGTSATVTAVDADLADVDGLLHKPELTQLIDFTRPVGVLLVAVLHFLPDDVAHQAVRKLQSLMVPGSYLVLSHGADDHDERRKELARQVYRGRVFPRPRAEVQTFFEGLTLIEPGIVPVHEWRANETIATELTALGHGGVGVKTPVDTTS